MSPNELPAGHELTHDAAGRQQVRCSCCGGREWIDTGRQVTHLRWCDNKPKPAARNYRRAESAVGREVRLAGLAARGLASPDHGLNRDLT